MNQYQVEIGDPDRDEVNASGEELFDLKDHPGWNAVKDHLREILDHRRTKLARVDISQREADRTRGQIELCEAILGESESHEPMLDMLINIANEQQQDGRQRGRRRNAS